MKRGEVWRMRLPSGQGHAQSGERPALVVQADQFQASLPTVLVVPFTSTLATQRFPGTLLITPDGTNGLTLPSVALVFQMRAIDKQACVQRLGTIKPDDFELVLDKLDELTGR